tara:strand:- start:7656 stop:8060 length:405 start_codon:yes stop_codon:yes gene_type:complete
MAQASNYLEEKFLTGLLGGTDVTFSGKPYIGLLKSSPSDSGGGTEVTGTNYARVQVGSSGQGSFTIGSTGTATNSSAFTFADAGSAWGTVTHIALYDAATGGNLLLFATLNASANIQNGDIFKVPASGFTITMD